jgi:hypothetical protein
VKHMTARRVPCIKVSQWLKDWDNFEYDKAKRRKRPEPHFYVFSIDAHELKTLTGINRRAVVEEGRRAEEIGIQRRHEKKRSDEISRFIRFGFPWSTFPESQRESRSLDELKKPGWLPTAVVVNILAKTDERRGRKVDPDDLITVDEDSEAPTLVLPLTFDGGKNWKPKNEYPLEVIDGQHRLWAFEEEGIREKFALPVVAFRSLDISWQAYLFYTINIKPKRINTSLAFDLVPLLRTEDWLDKFDGKVYRETRAQELTEQMWLHPASPWKSRINMLGDPGTRDVAAVTQGSWIRALLASYVKSSEGRGVRVGGLFGAPVGEDETTLPWTRTQQAAFLILVWQSLRDAVKKCSLKWAKSLREEEVPNPHHSDLAFVGPHTLLNQDQGVRAVLGITNDLCFVMAEDLGLEDWEVNERSVSDQQQIGDALSELEDQAVGKFLRAAARGLSKYDWRTANASGLSDSARTAKLAFRGSGGYPELKRQIFKLLARQSDQVGRAARKVRHTEVNDGDEA